MDARMRPAAAVVAVSLLFTFISVTGAAAQPPDGSIDWQPCEDAPDLDCAELTVPVDWSDPANSATIEIGLARMPATDPDARIGSVLMNPGGPGGSGVGMLKMGMPLISPVIAERFDVIGFDPRGIAHSTQVICDVALVDGRPYPVSADGYRGMLRANGELATDCAERTGELIDHVDTLDTVHDIEAIRVALGEGKLNYLGYSYGTLMGQQYAETYGENVRAMVLDGNMDHSLTSMWEFVSTQTAAAEKNFTAFAHWCDTDSACALHGDDTVATYGQLREDAKAGDLLDPETGNPIEFFELTLIAFNGSIFPENWAPLAVQLRNLRDQTVTPHLAELDEPELLNYVNQATWCQDWDYPLYGYAHWRLLEESLAHRYPNLQWTPYVLDGLLCAGSGIETTNPQKPLQMDDAPPVVMIGNLYDFATVYEWSRAAAEQSGASLITYEGFGHTIYSQGVECVDESVDEYFISLTLPPDGLSCPAVEGFEHIGPPGWSGR